LERPFGDDPCDLPLLETHECFVVALEEIVSLEPRNVNVRLPEKERRKHDPVIVELNEEIEEEFNSTCLLNPLLDAKCYTVWTASDWEQKFANRTIARHVHTRLKELLGEDDKRTRGVLHQRMNQGKDYSEEISHVMAFEEPDERPRRPKTKVPAWLPQPPPGSPGAAQSPKAPAPRYDAWAEDPPSDGIVFRGASKPKSAPTSPKTPKTPILTIPGR
jgi:hypothetical protein